MAEEVPEVEEAPEDEEVPEVDCGFSPPGFLLPDAGFPPAAPLLLWLPDPAPLALLPDWLPAPLALLTD